MVETRSNICCVIVVERRLMIRVQFSCGALCYGFSLQTPSFVQDRIMKDSVIQFLVANSILLILNYDDDNVISFWYYLKKVHSSNMPVMINLLAVCGITGLAIDPNADEVNDENKLNEEGSTANIDHQLTPAERRYIEQKERIDAHRLAKTANKSHRDRIEDFNQYLANMSEHYDIPKVGPG
ncbi:hypothetical protein QQ045_014813 [Rhodiola kirilowii]